MSIVSSRLSYEYLALEEVSDRVGIAFDLEADLAKAQVALGDFGIALHRFSSLNIGYEIR